MFVFWSVCIFVFVTRDAAKISFFSYMMTHCFCYKKIFLFFFLRSQNLKGFITFVFIWFLLKPSAIQ